MTEHRGSDPSGAPVDDRVARPGRADDARARRSPSSSGIWGVDPDVGEMAPMLRDAARADRRRGRRSIADGLGQLDPALRHRAGRAGRGPARVLAERQREVVAANRFGIPAQVHEECLTGLDAWRATIYPSPLCWAATFDPALVERMGARIGAHDALASASTRASRPCSTSSATCAGAGSRRPWARTRSSSARSAAPTCAAWSAAGVVATLKHFARLLRLARRAATWRRSAIGPRELADVILPPFEMALRAGARSVMNSYTDIDGVPAAADATLLTTLLRDTLGFTGTVVADYFSVAFLQTLHRVADDLGEAARLALEAGIDVELPSAQRVRRPAARARWPPGRWTRSSSTAPLAPGAAAEVRARPARPGLGARRAGRRSTSTTPESRALALDARPPLRRAARQRRHAPAARGRAGSPWSVPDADTSEAMLGCYSFPMHVLVHHPGTRRALEIRTVREALAATHDVDLRARLPGAGRRRRATSPRPPRLRPPAPTSASPCSATRPACSATARRARAATWPTSACPGGRRSCSRRCSRRARRSSPCCWSAAPTT